MNTFIKMLLLSLLPGLQQLIDDYQLQIDPKGQFKEEIDGLQAALNSFIQKILR